MNSVELKTSPLKLLAILVGSVFMVELGIMMAFTRMPLLAWWLEGFIDASVLVLALFPILYFAVFRPLTRLIKRKQRMAVELLQHRESLEELVIERTAQLNEILQAHEHEDVLAAEVMNRLLCSGAGDDRIDSLVSSASHNFSGDVISAIKTPDGGTNIMMLDAMGHGLVAAINALPATQMFHTMSEKGLSLAEIVTEINDKTHALATPSRFLAASFIQFDAAGSRIFGWIGGTPKVYVKSPSGVESFKSGNLPLGALASHEFDFEYFSAPWNDQSVLVTCTDGVIESKGRDGKRLGESWVFDLVSRQGEQLDSERFHRIWKESLEDETLRDDASILIINPGRYCSIAPPSVSPVK